MGTSVERFIDLGNGSWHYNYHIELVKVDTPMDGVVEEWHYDTVAVWGLPTYDSCVRAVIRAMIDETKEFALINRYNAYVLGLSNDESDRDNYIAYLREVESIKDMVRGDFEVWEVDSGI